MDARTQGVTETDQSKAIGASFGEVGSVAWSGGRSSVTRGDR